MHLNRLVCAGVGIFAVVSVFVAIPVVAVGIMLGDFQLSDICTISTKGINYQIRYQ